MTNTVRIDIEVNDNAAAATTAGQRIVEPMRRAADDIDKLFDKTSNQIGRSLDKIEQEAWKSGRGMDDAFGTAMSGLRRSLDLAREEAEQTGAGLHSSVGQSLNEIRKNADQLAQSLKPVAQATVPINANWEKTGRLISTELDRIERDAWESGRSIDKAFATALSDLREDFERVRNEGKKTGATLESELGESLLAIKQRMNDLRDDTSGGGFLSGLGDSAGEAIDSLTGGLTAGKAGILGAGAVLGTALMAGMTQAMEETRVGGLIAAQTGQATKEAGRLGALAGDIYADNFGESIAEVGEAITSLFQNEVIDTSASDAAIEGLSKKVLTVAQTTQDGIGEITNAAQQMVRVGLVGSFEEGLDVIQRGTEIGLNTTGELLDTIGEYSVQFDRMGLSAQEAFGLLEQATDAGARNVDIVADAIKEFAIQAQDAGSKAARGFRTLGMDAGEAMSAVAAGGEPAQEVLRQVLNRLQEMPPSVQRSTAAVDLFGTKAEDLGDALYSMDVDTVAESFGDFAGAVDQAGKSIEETTPGLDKLGRWFGDRFSDIGGFVVDAADTMADGITQMGEALFGSGDAANESGDAMEEWGSETWNANDAAVTLIQSIDELIDRQRQHADTFLNSAEAQADYNNALAEATELAGTFNGSLNENRDWFDLTSEAGQNANDTIKNLVDSTWDMVEALSADSASAEQLHGVIEIANGKLYDMFVQMGYDEQMARILADRMLAIPDVDPTVTVVDNATPTINTITSKLNSLDGKWINTYVNTIFKQTGSAPAGSPAGGGGLLGSSSGNAHGGVALGNLWGAQSGGMRHGSTLINEAGPEVAQLPNGTMVATAGATRALAEMGAFSGGGPVSVTVQLSADAGASAGEGQYIMGLVRRGVLRLKVASNGRDVVAA